MEVKVECGCGTHYKFDVEPVNQRMPWPVNCPVCGTDGTALANDIIQQTLSGQPAPAPVPAPQPAVPAVPPPPPTPRLRINREPEPPPATNLPAGVPLPPPPRVGGAPSPGYSPPRFPAPAPAPPKSGKSTGRVLGIIGTCLVVALVGFRVVVKLTRLVNVVSAVTRAVSDNSDEEWNLVADNEVAIYVNHTNHQEVADACATYFHQGLKRNIRPKSNAQDGADGNEFTVMAPYHNFIEFVCPLEQMNEDEFTGLAQHLSGKFNTLVFMEADVNAAGRIYFGAYESGTNQFLAKLDVKTKGGVPTMTATTQGNDWALAHGYQPGKKGFADFSLDDANNLTKKCGMKIWDRDDESLTNNIVLKEWGKHE